jgi:hypothetical protein
MRLCVRNMHNKPLLHTEQGLLNVSMSSNSLSLNDSSVITNSVPPIIILSTLFFVTYSNNFYSWDQNFQTINRRRKVPSLLILLLLRLLVQMHLNSLILSLITDSNQASNSKKLHNLFVCQKFLYSYILHKKHNVVVHT